MSGGLVQDYSKSPIKPTNSPLPEDFSSIPNTYQPATAQPTQPASPYTSSNSNLQPSRGSIDLSAPPPRKSTDVRPQFDGNPPRPQGQQHDTYIPNTPTSAYTSPYTDTQAPVTSYRPTNSVPTTQAGYDQTGPAGYRQNPLHDGGSTDYNGTDGDSAAAIAERTWKAASETVSEYTSTAGEVAGNAIGSLKNWLNPESKGMR